MYVKFPELPSFRICLSISASEQFGKFQKCMYVCTYVCMYVRFQKYLVDILK